MFPISFRRTIEVPIIGNTIEGVSETILNTLIQRIQAEKPSRLKFNQHRITFSGGSLFVGSWNLLLSIDYGVIDILPVNNKILISYQIWFTGLFAFALLASAIFGFSIFLQNLLSKTLL